MSGHLSPEQIHAKLGHPVIDGDGHWIEYTPVFAEKIRKAVGDKGANGFLASQRRIPDSLSLTLAERKRRGIAMEGYWGRQSTNTRDRATAMMPKHAVRPARRARHRFRHHLPDRRARHPAHRR